MKTTAQVMLVAAAILSSTVSSKGLELGAPAGPVRLETLEGDALVMRNYGERPATAVLFLSSRCAATEQALEHINALYRKYRLRNVLYVGVCPHEDVSGSELRSFGQRRGVIFPMYRDPSGEVTGQFEARATPEVFLLDHQGMLVFHGGLATAQGRKAFEAAVQSILGQMPIERGSFEVLGTPISQAAEKRPVDDPYGSLSFSSELVFEKIQGAPAHHCSTIAETAAGDLLCLWYGGSYESADDQVLFLSRRTATGRSWSEPEVLIRNPRQPPGNGVIFLDAQNRVWIVWGRMEASRPIRRGAGWGRCRLMYRVSTDDGRTWSEDRELLDETLWCVPRNPPIALADGTMLLPLEGSLNGQSGSHFLIKRQDVESWQRAGFTTGGSQPAVVQRADGSVLALLRHSRNITRIESLDGGKTWTDAVDTELKNPNAGISMTKLANGHLVLVFNDSQRSRTPLSITRSLDDGKTWEAPLHLESNPGEYSYPCAIQTADGKIHVSYTYRRYAIKHVEMNEDWLVHLRRPN